MLIVHIILERLGTMASFNHFRSSRERGGRIILRTEIDYRPFESPHSAIRHIQVYLVADLRAAAVDEIDRLVAVIW